MRRILVLLTISLAFASPSSVVAQRAPYTPEQLSLIRQVEECQLSPDGQTVAFVTDITGALELWTVQAAGGWPIQLTNLNEQVSDIRWSPDGKWIQFASDFGGNERRDLYRVAADGGAVEKLTDTKLSESEPRFAPDGKRIAFTADPDREFLFQLHVLDLQTRKTLRLTMEAVNVQRPVWSPDGQTIAVTRSGDDQKGELLLVDATSGTKVVVAPVLKESILWPVAFAPDGKSLLVLAPNRAGFAQLAVLELTPSEKTGQPPKPMGVPTFFGPGDWDVTEARWHQDGIYFLVNEGGSTRLYFQESPKAKQWTSLMSGGVMHQLSVDGSGTRLALLREDIHRPADVWILKPQRKAQDRVPFVQGEDSRQVTFSLMGGVKSSELAGGEMIAYESYDKQKIHTLLVKPRINRLGSPPPAVVVVHGGPNGQKTLAFDPFIQVLAETGFVVLVPNYRGSTGYGRAFEDANNKDWGGGDLKDLTAAVRHFAALGIIDPKRVAITGGSYGGYLTLMALCKTPEVWAVGVERYGMPDLVMDYLLSKSRFADWYETEMGNPKTDAALFRERSPLPYLDEIKAPLLIFQGAGDTNVPKSESDLLVAVLRELKKPHDYIVYDDEGHGFTRRKNLLDYYKRTTAFFVEHLKAR